MATRPSKTPAYYLHKATGQAVARIGGVDDDLGGHGFPESHAENDRLIAERLASGQSLP